MGHNVAGAHGRRLKACSDSQRLYIRVVLETSGDCRHGRPVPDMLPGHLRRHCEASASVNTQRFRHPMAGGSAGSARRPKEAKNAPKAEQGKAVRAGSEPAGSRRRMWVALLGPLVAVAVQMFRTAQPTAQKGRKQTDFEVWATARRRLPDALQMNVTCSKTPGGDGTGGTGLCGTPRRGNRCARFVLDEAIPAADVQELAHLLQWLVSEAWGGGSGPPSVLDLHAETLSYKDKFVNLTMFMEFKSLKFTQKQVEAYRSVRQALREQLSRLFGVPLEGLQHDMTFFSHINASKTAQTVHDQYWHSHIDTEQYGTFAYTVLLYLNTEAQDFDGGEFIFEESKGEGFRVPAAAVEPRAGRIVAFSSDAENPHKVLAVSRGVRMALTAAFTCSQEQAMSIQSFPNPAMVEDSGTAA
eukprot:s466_g4.t1